MVSDPMSMGAGGRMTGLISAISGQFSKSLFLGAFFPTVVFLVAGYLLIGPLMPGPPPLQDALPQIDAQWQLIVWSFLAVVLSGMLFNLNGPIIRLYEGYPWK